MWWMDLLFAFLVAVLMAGLLVGLTGWRHPSRTGDGAASAVFLLIILTLLVWAGGTWSQPYGPMLWGKYWLPFLVIGLVLALLLAATAPPRSSRPPHETTSPEIETDGAGIAALLGLFFWLLALLAVASIAFGYWNGPSAAL